MLVALALLGLSLSHLASGVAIVTGSGERDGWLMAVGIDFGLRRAGAYPACRACHHKASSGPLCLSRNRRRRLATSAAMNAFAFASHADGLMIYPAIGLGFAVPALVYALTKTGAIMYFARGSQ